MFPSRTESVEREWVGNKRTEISRENADSPLILLTYFDAQTLLNCEFVFWVSAKKRKLIRSFPIF